MKRRLRYIFLGLFFLFSRTAIASDKDTFHLLPVLIDTGFIEQIPSLKTTFVSKEECQYYLTQLPDYLQSKGYLSASADTVIWHTDTVIIKLYLGRIYKWGSLKIKEQDRPLMETTGFIEKKFTKTLFDNAELERLKREVLSKLENAGYPFASVALDTVQIDHGLVEAVLNINKGPQYRIDSIRVYGDASISKSFLYRYLHLPRGAVYQQKKLDEVSPLLKRLPYLAEEQPWQLNMLGTGSILDLYLKNKKSSQLNGFLGFLPATDQLGGNRMLLTGDLNIRLLNSFGKGESLQMQFQQIQVKSPRLQIAYQHPYIGGSAWGVDLAFDGFRKDSSFLNIRLQAGVQFAFGGNMEGKIFLQQFITTLDYIDTALIGVTKRLPAQLDQRTSFLGVDWKIGTLTGILNPRNGRLLHITSMAGIRNIRPNSVITSIKNISSPTFNYATLYDSLKLKDFTFRIQAQAEQYFPLGKIAVLRTSLNTGFIQNKNLFRNELFQIGGLQLLRGFDDQSIFASYYSIFSVEYRLLTGQSSYLFAFADAGHSQNRTVSKSFKNYLGTGIGTSFETKAGMFIIAFAVGGGGGVEMNLRQSKIHLGYINRF